ncbi:hypothetical protein HJFPF1_04749 [Paramyrothecium foliicola]|nr:hypothetical protein HJFPF1_04749 [Paramyrothecium foliicola]
MKIALAGDPGTHIQDVVTNDINSRCLAPGSMADGFFQYITSRGLCVDKKELVSLMRLMPEGQAVLAGKGAA